MSNPTPTPWISEEVASTGGENPVPVCDILSFDKRVLIAESLSEEDAALIVKAVNSYAKLVATLKLLATNQLSDANCASVEIASKRVSNVSRGVLKDVGEEV